MFNDNFYRDLTIMIKRVTLLALLGVSASSIALADTYNPPAPAQPCNLMCTEAIPGGFYVGVTGIYAQPSTTGIGQIGDSLQYQSADGQILSKNTPFEPSNHGGIGAKAGYDFASSANSLEFDYLHFNSSTPALINSGDTYSLGSIHSPNVVVPGSVGLVADAKLAYNLNQYDLWLAHTFGSAVSDFTFKPAIGIRYASASENETVAISDYAFANAGSAKLTSDFQGLGPEMGFDAHYKLGYGFGVIGHFDDAVLASRISGSSLVDYIPSFGVNSVFKLKDSNRVSNVVTARLGADYKYVFTNGSSLGLEGGYQAIQYSDAFDITQGNVNTTPYGQHIVGVSSEDFSLRGPYLTLTYHV